MSMQRKSILAVFALTLIGAAPAWSKGAMNGAKIAQETNVTTSTMPIIASGLRRARRGSEMAVVDISSRKS